MTRSASPIGWGVVGASLAVFAFIIGLPAVLLWWAGRPRAALWLVAGFLVLFVGTAYGLREVRKTQRAEK